MTRRVVLSAVAAGMVMGALPHAQRLTPADLAGKLSRTWVLYHDLSTGWGLDDGGHLVLPAKLESMTLMTPDEKAVFDRQ